MRDFKFRAWDKEEEVMLNDVSTFTDDFTDMLNSTINYLQFSKLVIMQYTGLKDKKGVEIYEGDIVSLERIFYTDCSRTEVKGEGYFVGTIKFYDNSWCIIRKHKEGFTVKRLINFNLKDEESDPDTEILTVKSNIYENPEILTEWERLI